MSEPRRTRLDANGVDLGLPDWGPSGGPFARCVVAGLVRAVATGRAPLR